MTDLILSPKYKRFMKYEADVEFLEGTTSAGKTTVGMVKFLLRVAQSNRKEHIISGLDLGTIEKNIIQSELGINDIFGDLVDYRSSGNIDHKLPHILYHTSNGEKVIYVLGYDHKARWKKALGGQYGCLYIDEINIADMEFVRETFMRADYVMATLNPDDPNLPIYHEYINHSRPLTEYEMDAPKEIRDDLKEEPKLRWVHWFFSFDHNAGLTKEKKRKIIGSVPKGSKLYKNKIQGIRGRAEGLILSNFEYSTNVITESEAKKRRYAKFSCGVDTSYSQESEDTVAFIFQGLSKKGELVVLEEHVLTNKDNDKPFAPSDIAQKLFTFLNYCKKKWGFAKSVYVDSADQATITELRKLKRKKPNPYSVINSDKSMEIVDRANMMHGWIHKESEPPSYLVVDHCDTHIQEINTWSWKGDKPEDKNDHTINASQYGFMPLRKQVGYTVKTDTSNTKDSIDTLRKLGV